MPSLAFVNRLHREPLLVLPVHCRLVAEDEVVLFEFIEEVALTPKIVFLPAFMVLFTSFSNIHLLRNNNVANKHKSNEQKKFQKFHKLLFSLFRTTPVPRRNGIGIFP